MAARSPAEGTGCPSATGVVAAPLMRSALKLYIALVCTSALLLLGHDLSVLALWPHTWSIGVTIALIVVTGLGDQLQFEVRRGWYTNASAVAHVGAAILLPPGLAMSIAAVGVIVRALRYPLPPIKTAFNIANISLAGGAPAPLASSFGGPRRDASNAPL